MLPWDVVLSLERLGNWSKLYSITFRHSLKLLRSDCNRSLGRHLKQVHIFSSWNSNISQIMYVCKYCQSSKWRGGIGLPTFNDQVGISPQNVNTSRQVSREKFSDKAIMYWCNINLSLLTFKELYGYRSVIEVVWLKGFRSVCSFTVLVLKLSFQNR